MPAKLPKSVAFVESVLSLKPGVATFDCDGTLWSGDAGEGFFSWELKQGFLSDEIIDWAPKRYAAYREGRVSEEQMCGEMVTMHRGLTEAEVQHAATRYFDNHFVDNIFPEMQLLVTMLQAAECEVWAISSSNQWLIQAAMRHFGIPENRVLAAAARVVDGKITDRLLRVPSGDGKPSAIHEWIRHSPDVAFGNSTWDAAMLGIAHHPFVINPTPQLKKIAEQRHWPVYQPEAQ